MSQKTYRIGEAAAKLNLKSYVLRFWETEFPQIAPIRTEKGQRLYRESDLAVLGRIRYLLHERGLTIDGARRLLREEAARGTLYADPDIPAADDVAGSAFDGAPDDADDDTPGDAVENDSPDASPGVFADTAGETPRAADGGTVSDGAAHGTVARAPVQASLFPPKADGGVLNQTELRGIVAELEAIRRLLVLDGDMP